MQFHEIFLYTQQLLANKQFYCEGLGFEKVSESSTSFSFQAGKSIIHFAQKEGVPIYHFAFNIPENQQVEALTWLKQRTAIIPADEDEIIDFNNWNAHAIYFADPAGNIVEFIARHGLPNASESPFSVKSILELSEIGMVNPDAPATYNQLKAQLGIQPYRQHTARFAAMGDEHGLFIVVPDNRSWYPTDLPSEVADFRVKGSFGGKSFSLVYKNGSFAVDL
jgi:catechol-2,3-dioxygenase